MLELGSSGHGVVGLTLAANPERVCLTDFPQLLPLLRANIEANGANASVEARPLA